MSFKTKAYSNNKARPYRATKKPHLAIRSFWLSDRDWTRSLGWLRQSALFSLFVRCTQSDCCAVILPKSLLCNFCGRTPWASRPSRATKKPHLAIRSFWLSDRDSNPNKRNQKPLCYHYTIGQLIKSVSLRAFTFRSSFFIKNLWHCPIGIGLARLVGYANCTRSLRSSRGVALHACGMATVSAIASASRSLALASLRVIASQSSSPKGEKERSELEQSCYATFVGEPQKRYPKPLCYNYTIWQFYKVSRFVRFYFSVKFFQKKIIRLDFGKFFNHLVKSNG